MSIRQQKEDYDRFKMLGITTPHAEHKLPGAVEDVCREIYNKGTETITFTSYHPLKHKMHFFGKPPIYWYKFQCPPGEWVFLPHGAYLFEVPSGSKEYPCVVNYGGAMFKGNTLPSRPEASQVRSFVPGVRSSRG